MLKKKGVKSISENNFIFENIFVYQDNSIKFLSNIIVIKIKIDAILNRGRTKCSNILQQKLLGKEAGASD